MVRTHKTVKPKNTKTAPYKRVHNTKLVSAALCASLAIITVLAVFSFKIAAIALSFLAFSFVLYYENRQRRFWEYAAAFKFKQIKDQQKRFSRDLATNRFDLDMAQDDIDMLAGHAPKRSHKPKENKMLSRKRKYATRPVIASRKVAALGNAPKRTTSPKITRKTPSITSAAPANYDPLADYESLSDMVVQELVHTAVNNDQIDVFVQPIMRLPQRQTRFYEIFARIRAKPGMYLPASRYMELARKDKLMNKIDHLLLMQSLQTIKNSAETENQTPFFINITTATLSNAAFMKGLLTFVSKNRALATQLVFEIKQTDFDNMSPAILEILRGLGRLGCSLSIDHVENLDFDIKFLQVLKVRFVKINTSTLLEKTRTGKDFTEMNRFKRRLEGNGIGFIVEKIEDEKSLTEILDFDIQYGQGYLLGRPDLQGAYKLKSA